MSKTGRGRPKCNHNTITINELTVEYLSTKEDNYKNDIAYFKIVDSALRAKMKPLFSLNDDGLLKIPIWQTDTNEHILKVKAKFINYLSEFVKNNVYIINLNFEFYNMEKENVKGYYAKIVKVVPVKMPPNLEIDITTNNEN